jgi:hypothetical protein
MNSVIDTLIAFMGGADTETLEQGIAIARELHDQYTLELARLLGLTVVPATVPVLSTPEETATLHKITDQREFRYAPRLGLILHENRLRCFRTKHL